MINSKPKTPKKSMSRPWGEIRKFYCELSEVSEMQGVGIRGMAVLVKKIEASRYASDLFAWTSMHTLCITQAPATFPYFGQELRITPVWDGKIEFRFVDCSRSDPKGHRASLTEEFQWHRVVEQEKAFERFEKFLDQMHWFKFDGISR